MRETPEKQLHKTDSISIKKKVREARVMQDHVASAGSWRKMRGANPQQKSPDWVGLEDVLLRAESSTRQWPS